MLQRKPHLPSIPKIRAFEAAARQGSFTRAAQELNISQSSVSRYILALEAELGVQLFKRERQAVILTDAGRYLAAQLGSALREIESAMHVVARWSGDASVVIGCTHAVSHLFLMPRFNVLKESLGQTTHLRVMAFEHDSHDLSASSQVDIMFGYGTDGDLPEGSVVVLQEAIAPVCSPDLAERYAQVLAGPLHKWQGLPFLGIDLANLGWSTWEDWFRLQGEQGCAIAATEYENYIYLLEDACRGTGLALGARHLIDGYLGAGRLVFARGGYQTTERLLTASLTPRGQMNPVGPPCLKLLPGLAG